MCITDKMIDCPGKIGSWMTNIKLNIRSILSPRRIQFMSMKRSFFKEVSPLGATLNDDGLSKYKNR